MIMIRDKSFVKPPKIKGLMIMYGDDIVNDRR